MPKVKLDNITYDLDKMSSDVREQIDMLLRSEQRIKEIQLDLVMVQTARNAYLQVVRKLLESASNSSSVINSHSPLL